MIIHVYSFSLFVSSKTRYHAEFKYIESSLLERLGMSRVLRNEKVQAISTLASGQDLFAVLKRYPTFTSCQKAACSNTFFFLWRVDFMLWRVLCFD